MSKRPLYYLMAGLLCCANLQATETKTEQKSSKGIIEWLMGPEESLETSEEQAQMLAKHSVLREIAVQRAENEALDLSCSIAQTVNPDMGWKQGNAIQKSIKATVREHVMPKYEQMIADLYLASFSEDELATLTEFYFSKEGRSIAAKYPKLAAEFKLQVKSYLDEVLVDPFELVSEALERVGKELTQLLNNPAGEIFTQELQTFSEEARAKGFLWWKEEAAPPVDPELAVAGPYSLHFQAEQLLTAESIKGQNIALAGFVFSQVIKEHPLFTDESLVEEFESFYFRVIEAIERLYDEKYTPDLSDVDSVATKAYREVFSKKELESLYNFFVVGEGAELVDRFEGFWGNSAKAMEESLLSGDELVAMVDDCNQRLAENKDLEFSLELWNYLQINADGKLENTESNWVYLF